MKKLMIAAAAAAMIGGAYAVCVDGETECGCGAAGANVWDVKFTAKTTVLKTGSASRCVGATVYRKQGTAKITGWIWNGDNCSGDCDLDFGYTMNNDTAPRMALVWNKKSGFTLTSSSIFVAQIDKKGNKLEAWGDMKDDEAVDLKFAGFGSYDTKKNLIKSISGDFAGTLGNDMVGGDACHAGAYGNMTYDCSVYYYDGAAPTAAYGSWSIKYNKSASKKAAKAAAGLGIVQPDPTDEDEDYDGEVVEIEPEDLDEAVAQILKFSKYGINLEDEGALVDLEIAIEDFAEAPEDDE